MKHDSIPLSLGIQGLGEYQNDDHPPPDHVAGRRLPSKDVADPKSRLGLLACMGLSDAALSTECSVESHELVLCYNDKLAV